MSDNGRLMVLGLIELGRRSNGSEPWSLWLAHLPPAASVTPLGKPKIGVTPPLSPSFYSSTKILMALKSMLPLLGPNGTSWPWPMWRIPSGRACWPVGRYRFDYEEGQRCFSSLSHKGGLVQHQDNGTSKWHVKLTLLCAIIQAFDLTNVFVPSTSANTSTSLHLFLSYLPLFPCQELACTRCISANEKGKGETERMIPNEKRRKELNVLEGKCWACR